MKPDYEIINMMLNIFLQSEKAFITIDDLVAGYDAGVIDEQFLFHFLLIVENGLLSNQNLTAKTPEDVGLFFALNGQIITSSIPIRLTQSGLDFANALNQKPVLERVKKELADAPFEFVRTTAGKLLSKILSERLGL
ncbi:DUF2513 domain-containing protein [Salmonella enterica subsp. enterica]|nr:DUF2513 domain-containing protein [Salmonella enterica subsp. enterica]EGC4745051.1 DUF2513 domain-containing protein [Salmonella enterica]EEG6275446.1 DUF2513 domain-containing protein [Salmonella enterica subsp. enterica]EHE9078402.1 DUF2513 domain-containing protein [Salmonella enterica]EIK2677077.1 DUF2513 domain-containing protein [Salmonella enterica]